MSLNDYLAKKYGGNEDKKRKKNKNTPAGLLILDEDAGFGGELEEEDQDERPVVVSQAELGGWIPLDNKNADKRKRRKSSPSPERGRRRSPSTEGRRSPSLSPDRRNVIRMADGTAAGLQSAESIRRDLMRQREKDKLASQTRDSDSTGKDNQTVYRDRLGKKVDITAIREEAAEEQRRKQAEEEEKKIKRRGMKQLEEKRLMKARLEQEKEAPLAVYVDDSELNERQRDALRWGDPMAHLVKTKKSEKSGKKSKSQRIEYQGHFPANRFGIPPGYRWDGIDRSNGFEAKYFKAQNARNSKVEDAYKWSTEDM